MTVYGKMFPEKYNFSEKNISSFKHFYEHFIDPIGEMKF